MAFGERLTAREAFGFPAAGAVWGTIAYALGARALGPSIFWGVLVSPVIGAVVGAALQRSFARSPAPRRALVALASLYLGATLFGLAIGAHEWLAHGAARTVETIWQSVAAVWYGVSLFAIALWPLTYLTHLALAAEWAWWRRPA